MNYWIAAVFIFLTGCSCRPSGEDYQKMYAHLQKKTFDCHHVMRETDFFLVFLVEARHLDYTDNESFFKTVAKHPSDCSKNGDVGHAWIYLEGILDGERICLEGGHSGELGFIQPRYLEGVMNYVEYGYANPTDEQKLCRRVEPDPIKYLWTTLPDGFFQEGSGGHRPTFAAKIDLSEEQFLSLLNFIAPKNYLYRHYALTHNQCSSFLARIGAVVDFQMDYEVSMKIDQNVSIAGQEVIFWQDEQYASITFSTPDVIERSLMEAVEEGKAEYALSWYLENHPECFKDRVNEALNTVSRFPKRLQRYLNSR